MGEVVDRAATGRIGDATGVVGCRVFGVPSIVVRTGIPAATAMSGSSRQGNLVAPAQPIKVKETPGREDGQGRHHTRFGAAASLSCYPTH